MFFQNGLRFFAVAEDLPPVGSKKSDRFMDLMNTFVSLTSFQPCNLAWRQRMPVRCGRQGWGSIIGPSQATNADQSRQIGGSREGSSAQRRLLVPDDHVDDRRALPLILLFLFYLTLSFIL
jgi:hypothetical protein